MAQNFSLSVIFKAIDQMTTPINKMVGGFKKIRQRAKNANKDLKKLNQSFISVGKAMTSIGKSLSLKVTAPIIGFGALSIKSAMSFQEAMNMVGAVTKTTGLPAFQMLENQAKELGRTTSFTAVQSAEAMKFLGMAGMDATEIMGAIPKVLQLAAAAQLDLGSSADIVTNIMRGMGLETEDLAHVNDVLVNAMIGANTDLRMLGEAFKYAGPIAKGAGLDIETTTALIAKMGDAGIQGSMAGTALRGMLLRLQNPAKNVSGIIKALATEMEKSDDKSERAASKGMFDLVGMIELLEKKGATAAQIAKLVGDRAGPGMAVLVDQGVVSLRDFIEKLREIGTAAEVQKAQLQGLPGAWKLMTSAFEGFQLALTDAGLSTAAEGLFTKIKDLLGALSSLSPEWLKLGMFIAGTAAVIGPLLIAIGGITTAFGLMGMALGVGAGSIAIVFIAAFAAIIGAAAGIYTMVKHWKVFWRELWEYLSEGWAEPIQTIKTFLHEIGEILSSIGGKIWEKTKNIFSKLTDIAFTFIEKIRVMMVNKLLNILPNWILNLLGWKGGGIKTSTPIKESSVVIAEMGKGQRSSADVNITLTADKGTEAKVDKVDQSKGDVNVNLATVGYVGTTNSWRDMM